jgi:hypothetical protein
MLGPGLGESLARICTKGPDAVWDTSSADPLEVMDAYVLEEFALDREFSAVEALK